MENAEYRSPPLKTWGRVEVNQEDQNKNQLLQTRVCESNFWLPALLVWRMLFRVDGCAG